MILNSDIRLSIRNLSLAFGGIQAIADFNVDVKDAQILGIIGPNGAGKTSVLNCISKFYNPQYGSIVWKDRDISKLPPYKVAQLGIARTFQNLALYDGLTVLENLMAARHSRMRQNMVTSALYFGWAHKEEIEHRERVEQIITFLELEGIRKKPVGALPYGQRKKVDLGRALALEPQLLLLDEPMAGMSIDEKADVARYIIDILDIQKIPMIIVEHDMGVVLDICDRLAVLDFGHKIAEGTPDEIRTNPVVITAYLGSKR